MATTLAEHFTKDAAAYELYARSAFGRIGARANQWISLQQSAARFGVKPEQVLGAELVQRHRAADALAAKVGSAILDLDAGRAELVPVATKQGQTPWLAVHEVGGELGVWLLLLRVVYVALTALAAGGVWKLGNAWLETKKADADAGLLRSDTAHKLAEQAQNASDPQIKVALAQAAADANAAASAGGTTWVDSLLKGLGAVAGVAGGFGLGWLAVLYLMSRSSGKGARR